MPNGLVAIVCGERPRRKRCTRCGQPSGFQCDWKTGEGKTCDRHLCRQCALEVAPEKHLCPEHQVAYAKWKAAALMRKLRETQNAPTERS